ncbi:MAG: MlaD family protein [Bacteroidota bacterium]
MSNEIRIGLLAIVAIGLMFWGYKFVEGQDIFSKTKTFYVEYDNVGGLTEGTNVMRSGVQVGIVTAVYLNPENLETVIVELDLEKDLPLPKNTVAAIATTDFLGEKNVDLIFNGPCNGTNCAVSGDFLKPGTRSVLATMTGGPEEIGKYVDEVTSGVSVLMDSLGNVTSDPNSPVSKILSDVDDIMTSLKKTTASLNAVVATNSRAINQMVSNLNNITMAIQNRDEELERILVNADTLMQNLAAVNLDGTLQTADGAINNLNTTMKTADQTVADLQKILVGLKAGEGTLGQLIANDDLYKDLEKSIQNLDLLLEDFRLNPARYTTILRKKRPKYEASEEGNQKEDTDN